jgi:uncharacterized protein involved in response to NO
VCSEYRGFAQGISENTDVLWHRLPSTMPDMSRTETNPSPRASFALFAYGFRPFFLAAGAYAVVGIGLWLWMRASGWLPFATMPPQLWHGHEMLFGFVGAAIAGFLLTAVPSWTGERGFGGRPLIMLTALWLVGRLAFFFATALPGPLVLVAELLFLPGLAFLIAPPLLRSKNRNTPLLIVLCVLWLIDGAFLYALLTANLAIASSALRVGIDVVLLLITVIGGRIVPAFTGSALRNRGVNPQICVRPWLEITTVAAMVLVIVSDAIAPRGIAAGTLAAAAALAHLVRLAGWQGLRTLKEPIVWVLHAAYACLPLGFALKAVDLLSGAAWSSQWLHVLTMGAAMMIVAVITRAALGHTGRPLRVSRTIAVSYGVLAGATVVRAFAGAVSTHYEQVIRLSGVLWLLAFALILIIYAPILIRPRADGRPG